MDEKEKQLMLRQFRAMMDQIDIMVMAVLTPRNWYGVLATMGLWLAGFFVILFGLKNTVDPFSVWGPIIMAVGIGIIMLAPKLMEKFQ